MEDISLTLDQILYIYYLLCFKKNTVGIKALINSGSEINIKTLINITKLDLKVCHTNVKAKKIYSSTLKTFKTVLASFYLEDKLDQARFFWKIFLLANISVEILLEMSFLTFNKAEVLFQEQELIWRSYTTAKALSTIM